MQDRVERLGAARNAARGRSLPDLPIVSIEHDGGKKWEKKPVRKGDALAVVGDDQPQVATVRHAVDTVAHCHARSGDRQRATISDSRHRAHALAACPVEAIFEEDAVPDKWKDYTAKNADYFEKK